MKSKLLQDAWLQKKLDRTRNYISQYDETLGRVFFSRDCCLGLGMYWEVDRPISVRQCNKFSCC